MNQERETPSTQPNLILTGFMGTGKSSVGRLLARRLKRPFVDTDKEIEKRQKQIATRLGFELEGHSLSLYGVCEDCRKKEKSKK